MAWVLSLMLTKVQDAGHLVSGAQAGRRQWEEVV
jgi:hypothetical protein